MRGIFFESADAEEVAARLRADGYEADVEIERLAGEDDDEDHQWSVRTDAPAVALELLVDAHEGWFDAEETQPPVAPLDLPAAPRRNRRPQ